MVRKIRKNYTRKKTRSKIQPLSENIITEPFKQSMMKKGVVIKIVESNVKGTRKIKVRKISYIFLVKVFNEAKQRVQTETFMLNIIISVMPSMIVT